MYAHASVLMCVHEASKPNYLTHFSFAAANGAPYGRDDATYWRSRTQYRHTAAVYGPTAGCYAAHSPATWSSHAKGVLMCSLLHGCFLFCFFINLFIYFCLSQLFCIYVAKYRNFLIVFKKIAHLFYSFLCICPPNILFTTSIIFFWGTDAAAAAAHWQAGAAYRLADNTRLQATPAYWRARET